MLVMDFEALIEGPADQRAVRVQVQLEDQVEV
jgi:hypothetical protein